jgi:aminopeptidase N
MPADPLVAERPMDIDSTTRATPSVTRRADYAPPAYRVDSVELTFDLHEDRTIVTAHSVIHACDDQAPVPPSLRLDGIGLELEALVLDGRALAPSEYTVDAEGLTITRVPRQFTLEVVTIIHPEANTALEGLYKSSGNFCTQCEARGFRKITYFLDRPDVMARYTTTIIADRAKYPVLLSNGNRGECGPVTGKHAQDRHFATWVDPWPKPSYLFALVAGNLVCARDTFTTMSGREVGVEVWVEQHNLDKCDHALASMKRAMRWDEEAFGREYDLDAYMIFSADDFNMGAMENKGLNVFNSKYVLAKAETATDADFEAIEAVIAHEYFHNWTGNRVTCRDWFQLSLKEGLTVFRDQQFTADMTSKAVKRIADVRTLRSHQFPEDGGPLAHPVRPDAYIEISNFYTATVYEKGAEVIRMMHTLLGPEKFRAGMDLYFERHDGQAATCDDFAQAMQDASGVDLTLFRRWYSQAGTPEVTATTAFDAPAQRFTLTLTQHTAPTPGQPDKQPLQIPVRMSLLDGDGKPLPLRLAGAAAPAGTEVVLSLTEAQQRFDFEDLPSAPVPSLLRGFSAPVKLNLDCGDAELAFLMGHDDDPFNRWEAGQRLATRILLGAVAAFRAGQPIELPGAFIDAFGRTLADPALDGRFKALALTLPDFTFLGEQMAQIDVEGLHAAREAVVSQLARAHGEALAQAYQANEASGPYRNDGASVARRALRNTCLAYLSRTGAPDALAHALRQFDSANNMTDQIAALSCIVDVPGQARQRALDAFHAQWQADPLVIDKWLALQARSEAPDALAQVRALMNHPAYDARNPNRIRALVGVFCHGNPLRFHQADGSGYAFLREQVLKLDRQNPQVASRMLGALNRWRKYDPQRQALMRAELQAIAAQETLSKDVYEVATKALG